MPTALDTEAVPATVSRPIGRLVSVAVAGDLGRGLWPVHAPGLVDIVRAVLRDGMVAHNAAFDVLTMLGQWPELYPDVVAAYEAGRIFDTMTRAKMLDIAAGEWKARRSEGYALDKVAARYAPHLVPDKSDPWRMRYGELLGLEISQWPQDAIAYAIGDVDTTISVFHAQSEADELGALGELAHVNARAHVALYQQTVIGIHTDQAQVDRVEARLNAEIEALSDACVRAGLARWVGKKSPKLVANTKAAAAAMIEWCDAHDLVPEPSESRAVSLSEDAMIAAGVPGLNKPQDEVIVGGAFVGHPLDAVRRLKATRTLRTKSIPTLRRPTIRCRYGETVDTGRSSSSDPAGRDAKGRKRKLVELGGDVGPDEWSGTNLQNQPTHGGFRECLVPPPGHVFLISDFTGAELVALGQVQIRLFGRSALAEAMIDPRRDVHRELAAKIFGKPQDEITSAERKVAKPANFGLPVGMGIPKYRDYAARKPYFVTLSEDEAKAHRRAWRETWPESGPYLDWVASLEGYDGWINMRHPITGYVRGGCRFTEAANSPFQSLAAFAAKRSLWYLWRAGYEPGPLHGVRQVLFVHDEHVSVCPRERAEEALAAKEQIMIDAFAYYCPDVPVRVESKIAERYGK